MLQAFTRLGALAAILWLSFAVAASAAEWQPVTSEELQMKREPKAPTASAIYLYRQVDRNDAESTEYLYSRIKILTDEGRKHANVELPYLKGVDGIRSLEARVIHADGSIAVFDGTVYDKPLVKARGVRMMAKSFTLPNVEVGSIIEYRYRRSLPKGWAFDSRWLLSDNLFTRHGVFSLRPVPSLLLRWSWPMGLPPDTQPPAEARGMIRMETHDVPAFVTEEFMPPEDAMKYRVDFVYEGQDSDQRDEAAYWKAHAKRYDRELQRFVGAERVLQQEVARLVQPGDSNEAKARKIYARALQIRNLSFERQATEQETRREDREEIDSAKEALAHGYANADQITWLLYGLLRAAKLEASLVLVSTRDDHLFNPSFMNSGQLNTCVVFVKLDTDAVFLDPGTPFMPFGFLPWSETAVKGLQLGGTAPQWITTSLPGSAESNVQRKAVVKLSAAGTLEGKVTVLYTGLEAAWRRVSERDEDATARRKFLEDEVTGDVPTGIEVKLVNEPDWAGAETPLVAEFELSVPGWAVSAGNRTLLPIGLFSGSEKHVFEHSARVHPLYFTFPYRHTDDVVIELPAGYQASIPKEHVADIKVGKFHSSAQLTDATLTTRRELIWNTILIAQKHYPQVRDFYQAVRAGDEEQIVLTRGAAPSAAARH